MMNNEKELLIRYLEQQRQMFGEMIYHHSRATEQSVHIATEAIQDSLSEVEYLVNVETDAANVSQPLPVFQPPVFSTTMFEEQPAWTQATSLDILHKNIHTCTQCRLGTSRTNFVFGTGNPNADLVIIGEAPGADEDAQGIPFVGRAGQLLTKILEAINFSREDVYICNILKCRPPENRRPHADEVEQCEPYLYKQLALIQPKFILALGLTAAETLLKNKYKMAELRGSWVDYHGARMMVTYHPAALLRNPEWKKYAWEDVQHLRRCYDHYRTSGDLPETQKL